MWLPGEALNMQKRQLRILKGSLYFAGRLREREKLGEHSKV